MASNENPTPNTECTRFKRRRLQRNSVLENPLITSHSSPSLEITRCKSSISSLFFSTFTPNTFYSSSSKKKGFASALGCASPSEVSSPAAIRPSDDWQAKRVRKKKQRKKKRPTGPAVVVPDVWCSPGIAFAADAPLVNCVVSRRPLVARGRGDGERNRWQSGYSVFSRIKNPSSSSSATDCVAQQRLKSISPLQLRSWTSSQESVALVFDPSWKNNEIGVVQPLKR